jgi:hypothetical protein
MSGYEEYVTAVSIDSNFDASGDNAGYRRFVGVTNVSGKGKIDLAGAAARAVGVLLSKPVVDQPGRVGINGIVPVEAGVGGIVAGGEVSVGAGGLGIAQSASNPSRGTALESAAEGEIFPCLLHTER